MISLSLCLIALGGWCLAWGIYRIATFLAVRAVKKHGGGSWRHHPRPERFDLGKGRTPWLPRPLDLFWAVNNADEDYDRSFRPNLPHLPRKILYALRNPFHNLFFYGLGIADQSFIRHGIAPGAIWGPGERGVNIAYIETGDGKSGYPFVSCREMVGGRELQFYLGWRQRGNFGIVLRWTRRK